MGWSCDPWRFSFSNMATVQEQAITFEDTELLSYVKILCTICVKKQRQGLSKRDPRVVQAVMAYFNRGPAPHQMFDHLVWQLAHTI